MNLGRAEKLIAELRETPFGSLPQEEWDAKCEAIEEALGLVEVPPGRFELGPEDFENLPVLNMEDFEQQAPDQGGN